MVRTKRTTALFLTLLVLCLGPGWAWEAAPSGSGETGAPAELAPAMDHQPVQQPEPTTRLKPPERSFEGVRAVLLPVPGAGLGPSPLREGPPLPPLARSCLHLALCVFLC